MFPRNRYKKRLLLKVAYKKSLILLTLYVLALSANGQSGIAPLIRHSDILISTKKPDKILKQYHISGVAWGFLPKPLNGRTMNKWKRDIERVQSKGLKFQARIEFDARWENMIDYDPKGFSDQVMRTLDGKMLIAPWFAERKYKGNPAYWFCSNSPGFRSYLEYQADLVLSGNPDYIMLDAQTSTALPLKWYAACFCDHCLRGFRKYLDEYYSGEDLSKMGINTLPDFDYAEFLKSKGYNDERFIKESRRPQNEIPMFEEYRRFHVWSVNDLTHTLSRYIDQQAGQHVTLSTSSPPHQPYRSVIIPEVSHYTLEMGQDAGDYKAPYRTITKYKIAEAVNKKVIVTALPKQDWKIILEEDRPGLVRTWIVQAYAHGANFMVPLNQWASGYKRYTSKPEDIADLYDFIHEYAHLFDGYQSINIAGVVVTNNDLINSQAGIDSMVSYLTKVNMPFRLILADEGYWDSELWTNKLPDYKVILQFNGKDYMSRDRKIISWPDTTKLFEILPSPIIVQGSNKKISVLPRTNPDNASFPLVCHIVNREYDKDSDSIIPHKEFLVSFNRSFIDMEPTSAILFRPGNEPVELKLIETENDLSVQIPEVAEWGIIVFKTIK